MADKEKGMQLYLRDNGWIEFRTLELDGASLIERNTHDEVSIGWPHLYENLFPFDGYKYKGKNIPAGMVTVSFSRDIIWDEAGIVDDKPTKGGGLIKEWITKRAESQRYRTQIKPGTSLLMNRITLFLGIGIIGLLLLIGLKLLLNRGV